MLEASLPHFPGAFCGPSAQEDRPPASQSLQQANSDFSKKLQRRSEQLFLRLEKHMTGCSYFLSPVSVFVMTPVLWPMYRSECVHSGKGPPPPLSPLVPGTGGRNFGAASPNGMQNSSTWWRNATMAAPPMSPCKMYVSTMMCIPHISKKFSHNSSSSSSSWKRGLSLHSPGCDCQPPHHSCKRPLTQSRSSTYTAWRLADLLCNPPIESPVHTDPYSIHTRACDNVWTFAACQARPGTGRGDMHIHIAPSKYRTLPLVLCSHAARGCCPL